ncbi:hypothetical protein R6V09_47060 [Streptomyces sp. W16]|uniref:hypothetical protein n=1 Tax=Streptomyces sp. W16 TaxID=3076631 RepID=UPI00295B8F4F|nr:hypothetical protein [Streptomyces sp. W16]MDV9177670.1 hypothetical protein [Streptomyces sp. W16]
MERTLTAEATAAAPSASDPETVLALLDSGRCVQWNARLQNSDELGRPTEVRPDLAASVRELTALFGVQETVNDSLPTGGLPMIDDAGLGMS